MLVKSRRLKSLPWGRSALDALERELRVKGKSLHSVAEAGPCEPNVELEYLPPGRAGGVGIMFIDHGMFVDHGQSQCIIRFELGSGLYTVQVGYPLHNGV